MLQFVLNHPELWCFMLLCDEQCRTLGNSGRVTPPPPPGTVEARINREGLPRGTPPPGTMAADINREDGIHPRGRGHLETVVVGLLLLLGPWRLVSIERDINRAGPPRGTPPPGTVEAVTRSRG